MIAAPALRRWVQAARTEPVITLALLLVMVCLGLHVANERSVGRWTFSCDQDAPPLICNVEAGPRLQTMPCGVLQTQDVLLHAGRPTFVPETEQLKILIISTPKTRNTWLKHLLGEV